MFKTIEDMTGYEKNCRWCHEARRPCCYHKSLVNQQEKSKGMKLKTTTIKTDTKSLQNLVYETYNAEAYWSRLLEVLLKKNIVNLDDLTKIVHGTFADQYKYEIEEESSPSSIDTSK